MGRTWAVGMLLVTTGLLAGCGGDAPEAQTGASKAASVVEGSDAALGAQGTIVGTVVSDEEVPINGARISLTPAALEATTDAGGAFAFRGLSAGTYSIFAERLGYETLARRVELAADQTQEVRLVLKAIQVVVPYNETKIVQGYWMCDAPVGPLVINCQDAMQFTGPRPDTVSFEVGPGWNTTVFELNWQGTGPTSSTANDVYCFMSGLDKKNKSYGMGAMHGKNPWRVEFKAGEGGFPDGDAYKHSANCYPKGIGNDNGLNRGVGLVIDQRWNVYASMFYHEAPPAGFSAVPK